MIKKKCLRCDYEWIPRKDKPSTCPACHSKNWHIKPNQKCKICDRIVFSPFVHHIDGNPKNDSKENRLIICEDCHMAIHFGIGSQQIGKGGRKAKRRNYGFSPKRKRSALLKELIIVEKLESYQNQLKQKWR